jgi:ribosomal protein S27E
LASNMYAIKCPGCERAAFEDDYYKTDEKYIFCMVCGYYYTKTIEKYTENSIRYKEEEREGNGMFVLVKIDGCGNKMRLNDDLSVAQLEKLKASLMEKNVNQEKSYLISFKNGEFTILFGNPPEHFHLSFEEYRKKMIAKYGDPEYDFMVPIEG